MIVIKIFKDNALHYSGKTFAIDWEKCIKYLKLYFPDIAKVKDRIKTGEIINTPYSTFRKDRRIENKKVDIEKR